MSFDLPTDIISKAFLSSSRFAMPVEKIIGLPVRQHAERSNHKSSYDEI